MNRALQVGLQALRVGGITPPKGRTGGGESCPTFPDRPFLEAGCEQVGREALVRLDADSAARLAEHLSHPGESAA